MTIESWKQEFYPVEAGACPEGQEIQHSLLKWTGLKPENLKKHDMDALGNAIEEVVNGDYTMKVFSVDASTCALCQAHSVRDEDDDEFPCSECPLSKLGANGVDCNTEYEAFTQGDNPDPMLEILNKALALAASKET